MKAEYNLSSQELVVSISNEEIRQRMQAGVVELIVTRLADKFIQTYGDRIIYELATDEKLKEEVMAIIKKRLADETENQIQKVG